MFQKLGDALRRFMYGRYGADSLNKWLLIFAVILMLLDVFQGFIKLI